MTLLFVVFSIGCSKKDGGDVQKPDSCIPHIITERNRDTLQIGNTYRAKVYLSDNSFLFSTVDGETWATKPIFRINGKLIEANSDYFIFEERVVASNTDTLKSGTVVRDWSVGIIFPHPVWGDVEVSQRNTYVIKDKNLFENGI